MSGLAGLSMFLVPAYEDGPSGRKRIVGLGRIEEKLGHHASVTAQLDFERAPAMLIGERGEGFEYMLPAHEQRARSASASSASGCRRRRIRLAAAYAAERKSMGKTIDKHEMIADYLDEMRTDAQALRALCVHGAFHEELAQKKLLDRQVRERCPAPTRRSSSARSSHHKRAARRVTPLLKYFGAEKAVEIGAPLRADPRRRRLYEGLRRGEALARRHGHADLRGHQPDPGAHGDEGHARRHPQEPAALRAARRAGALARRCRRATRSSAAVARMQTLSFQAQQHLILRTAGDKLKATAQQPVARVAAAAHASNWNPKRDFAYAMLHAERLTRLLVDEVDRRAAPGAGEEGSRTRRELAERWVERAEPRCAHLVDEITSTGDRLLATLHRETAAVEEKIA